MKKQLPHRAATRWQRRLLLLLAATMTGLLVQAQSFLNITVDARNMDWTHTGTTIETATSPDFKNSSKMTLPGTPTTITYPDGNTQEAYLLLKSPLRISKEKKLYYRLTCPALADPIVEDSINLEAFGEDWETRYPHQTKGRAIVVDLGLLQGKVPVKLLPTIGVDGNIIPSVIYVMPNGIINMAVCLRSLLGNGADNDFARQNIYATPGQTLRYVTLPTGIADFTISNLGISPDMHDNKMAEITIGGASDYLLHTDSIVVTDNNNTIQTDYKNHGRTYFFGIKDLDGQVASVRTPDRGLLLYNYHCFTEEHFIVQEQVLQGNKCEVNSIRLAMKISPGTAQDNDGHYFWKFRAIPGKQELNSSYSTPHIDNDNERFNGLYIGQFHAEFAEESYVWDDYSKLNHITVRYKGGAALDDITINKPKYYLCTPDDNRIYYENVIIRTQDYYRTYTWGADGNDICYTIWCSPIFKQITVYPSISGLDATLPAQTARFGEGEIVYDLSPYISSGIGTSQLDDAPQAIFSVDGRRRPALQRGVNIVRRADGTMHKVFVK